MAWDCVQLFAHYFRRPARWQKRRAGRRLNCTHFESLEARMLLAADSIAIGEGGVPWSEVVETGQLRPVNPLGGDRFTQVAREFYQSQEIPFGLIAPTLVPDVPVDWAGEQHASLLAKWRSDAAFSGISVAAWQYDYFEDSGDLTNGTVSFSVGVPAETTTDGPGSMPAIRDISLQLIDVRGNSRGWFAREPEIGWGEYAIQVDVPSSQGAFHFFDTANFDLGRIASIRLDAGSTSTAFPSPPDVPVVVDVPSWTAWNHLRVEPSPDALVDGVKFHDLDADGARDLGEPGLAGIDIRLTGIDQNGVSVEMFTTTMPDNPNTVGNETGRYRFNSVPPGTYQIEEMLVLPTGLPAPWQQSAPAEGRYDVVLEAGDTVPGLNFGNYQPASVQGLKFEDTNGNGQRENDEPGLGGWTIELVGVDGAGNAVHRQVQTSDDNPETPQDEAGRYGFENLRPGRYFLREASQAGWQQSLPGTNNYELLLGSGDRIEGLKFGNFRPGSISGRKFLDLNGDGQQGPGEPGLSGWLIVLDGTDGSGSVVRRTVTTMTDNPLTGINEAGLYRLDGLRPGSYQVREQMQAGWGQSAPSQGAYQEKLLSGDDRVRRDFGNFLPGSIRGLTYEDLNGNGARDSDEPGLAGARIVLSNQNGPVASVMTMEDDPDTTPNEAGLYVFSDVAPGQYSLSEVTTERWQLSEPASGEHAVSLISGARLDGLEFGNYLPVTVSGRKFLDLNQAAVHEPWEPGLAGWKIMLSGVDGKGNLVDRETETLRDHPLTDFDEAGFYRFEELPPGTYQIVEATRAGWTQTLPTGGYRVTVTSGTEVEPLWFLNRSPYRCDLNGDAYVDAADVAVVFSRWGQEGGPGDLDSTPVVDAGDAAICFAEWTSVATPDTTSEAEGLAGNTLDGWSELADDLVRSLEME